MANKRKVNEQSVAQLQYELEQIKKDRAAYRTDNDALRSENIMLIEILKDLTENKSYWSEEALQSGFLFRLNNILSQIKQQGN